MPTLIDINNTIILELLRNKLKIELNKEKSYKVQALNIYYKKNLDK